MKSKEIHEKAIEYYRHKIEKFGATFDDSIEILFHQSKSNPDKNLISSFLAISGQISLVHHSFKRLIDVGEEIKNCFESEDKAPILGTIGNLLRDLRRFADSEKAFKEAFDIYRKLAEKDPDVYLPDVATIQNNLGTLYSELGRFADSEKAYKEALQIRRKLAEKDPDVYLPDVAMTQNNLGTLYGELGRFADSEKAFKEALQIRRKLAEKDPDVYLHSILQTRANLAMLYIATNRTKEAITALEDILKQRVLLPDFGAKCFEALGRAYEKLANPQKAVQNYLSASANYFKLFTKGIPCLSQILNCLTKTAKLGDREIKGDAELMLTAISKLMGREVNIPQFQLSRRGKAIKEALNGRKVEFHPEDEIDTMVLTLAEEILLQKS